jgi:hypothetical protein
MTTANRVKRTFKARRIELADHLHRSRSRIHLTTDTWHSPDRKQLQAITAHWLRDDRSACKVLLSLTKISDGHAGLLVAAEVIRAPDVYGIRNMLEFTTTAIATFDDIITAPSRIHWAQIGMLRKDGCAALIKSSTS